MKRLAAILIACILGVAPLMSEEAGYHFSHGPYMQELTYDGVTFVFTTDKKGFSWVEVKKKGSPDESKKAYYTVRDGLREADVMLNSVRVKGLSVDESYEYRLCSKEITSFKPYSVKFGEEIVSPWYEFKTFSPKATKCSLIAMADMHDKPEKLAKLLEHGDYPSMTACFLVGDIMSNMYKADQPYVSYVDQCTEMFAKNKPFVLVRGNHETRGTHARSFARFVPRENGKIYGTQSFGDTFVIFLDCGEDKVNDHREYYGLVDFDGYRSEQAEWLKDVVSSSEFKKAKHRIVFSHFPTTEEEHKDWHGIDDLKNKTFETLNKAKIDLMVSGHTHEFKYHEPVDKVRSYPVLVGSDNSAVRIDVDETGVKFRAYDADNKTLLEKELN